MADPSVTLKTTPLHGRHVQEGARMMAFGGFEMPVWYTSIIEEHLAVRRTAGLFDVSHMGQIFVRGPQASRFVQHLITNDVAKLYDGRALYTVLCTEEGGVVDDLLVYRLAEDDYLLVVNAANVAKDFEWMQAHNPMHATLANESDAWALLALQGPTAFGIAQPFIDVPLDEIDFYHFRKLPADNFLGCERVLISHTGYTGEHGLEIYCEPERAADVWDALLEAGERHGLKPAGLGARDTLRLEAGYCLYGNDLTEETNPLEAGLGWVVKMGKEGDFVGRTALEHIKSVGTQRKLVGFVMEERGIPRPGQPFLGEDEEEVGAVTSGTQSPVLERGIGLGYVPNDPAYTEPGRRLHVLQRGRARAATVHKPPFHEK